MTPKEKAKDLFDKMYNSGDLTTYASKKCALKAVDEILSIINYNSEMHFWLKVKREILAL
jgi:hypothetical protein